MKTVLAVEYRIDGMVCNQNFQFFLPKEYSLICQGIQPSNVVFGIVDFLLNCQYLNNEKFCINLGARVIRPGCSERPKGELLVLFLMLRLGSEKSWT